jgi:Tat protein secretion system quality control protein TatD with DNase activity
LLSLEEPAATPSKRDHYRNIFLPPPESKHYGDQERTLDDILPGLPEPTPFPPLLTELKQNIRQAQERGQLVMLGEVGLDKSFRVPYPHILPKHQTTVREAEDEVATSGQEELAHYHGRAPIDPKKVLTPFRPKEEHQIRLLEMQMEVAVEFGVNVSLHSVRCQGPTVDFLRRFAKKHSSRFTERVNVDIHSCGGWSVQSWVSAEVS